MAWAWGSPRSLVLALMGTPEELKILVPSSFRPCSGACLPWSPHACCLSPRRSSGFHVSCALHLRNSSAVSSSFPTWACITSSLCFWSRLSFRSLIRSTCFPSQLSRASSVSPDPDSHGPSPASFTATMSAAVAPDSLSCRSLSSSVAASRFSAVTSQAT